MLFRKRKEKINNSGNTGHPERDQFREGKIGSGYMSTIEGQPHLDQFADVLSRREKNAKGEPATKSRNSNEV